MPFKMMGKSPLMKKLVGKQGNLPENLKAEIKAAPSKMKDLSGDGKVTKKDVLIGKGVIKPDGTKVKSPVKFIPGLSELLSPKPKKINYPKVDKFEQDKIDKENLRKKLEKERFDQLEKEQEKFEEESGIKINGRDVDNNKNKDTSTKETTQDKTQKIAQVEQEKTKIGTGKPLVFGKTNKFGSDSINAGREAMSAAGSTSTLAENIKNNVTDKVQVGSGSTKRLPIDAVQDRLTKNIDRRTRKSDVRKQTRTAKKSLRQEGFKRSAARDKVGKLGINPNTGKSFENAKQKQDFINAKGKDTFISDLQKKIGKTMKKSGVDLSGSNKKETGSTSKVPKINAFGNEGVIGGQSFGITNPKKKATGKSLSAKKSSSNVSSAINVGDLINKGRKASDKVASKRKNKLKKDYAAKLKKDNDAKFDVEPTKEQLTSNKIKPSEGQVRREVRRARRETTKEKKQGNKELDRVSSLTSSKTNKNVVKDSKKPNVPSSIAKVPVAKRPALYDDGYKDESPRTKSSIKQEIKTIKETGTRKKRKKNLNTKRSINQESGQSLTDQDLIKKLRKEKRKSPAEMKTKTQNKMMKKAPSKMKKKSPAKNYKKGYYGIK
jgi:hypothetical protein